MRIGIDARLIEETGVGRYIRNLIAQLSVRDRDNEYVVFLDRNSFDDFILPNKRWTKVLADIRWHTAVEQFAMPLLFLRSRLHVVHVPYYNIPVLSMTPLVVTVHDLIPFRFPTGKASTLAPWLYSLKRAAFWWVAWRGMRKARAVIAVSEATKADIVNLFHIRQDKIVVTHEGVDEELIPEKREEKREKRKEKIENGKQATDKRNQGTENREQDDVLTDARKNFLYVGNAYPHKNLEMLLTAWRYLISNNPDLRREYKLVLVGHDPYFYPRLKAQSHVLDLDNDVVFFGAAENRQLQALYSHAFAFVTPSLAEGFGLPGLEAMANGVPVACSDIPVFHEIYGDAALMFDPGIAQQIVDKCLLLIHDRDLRAALVQKGRQQAGRYSWETMAKATKELYEHVR